MRNIVINLYFILYFLKINHYHTILNHFITGLEAFLTKKSGPFCSGSLRPRLEGMFGWSEKWVNGNKKEKSGKKMVEMIIWLGGEWREKTNPGPTKTQSLQIVEIIGEKMFCMLWFFSFSFFFLRKYFWIIISYAFLFCFFILMK